MIDIQILNQLQEAKLNNTKESSPTINEDSQNFAYNFLTECQDKQFYEVDIKQLARAYLYVKSNLELTEIEEIITEINPLLTYTHFRVYTKMISTTLSILNQSIPLLSERRKQNEIDGLKKKTKKGLTKLLILHYIDQNLTTSFLDFIGYAKKVQELSKKHSNKEKLEQVKYKTINKQYYSIQLAEGIFTEIKNYCQEIVAKMIKKENKEKRKQKKQIDIYNSIYDWLVQSREKQEIYDIPPELLSLQNEELTTNILKAIYQHNQEYYTKIEKEYKKLTSMNENYDQYLSLFNKFNLDKSRLEEYLHYDISQLTKIVEYLNKLNTFTTQEIQKMISINRLTDIESIITFIEKGIISKKLIIDHKHTFINLCSLIVNNIGLLQEENINVSTIVEMNDYIMIKHQKFENVIGILKTYQLLSSLKNSHCFDFLLEEDLEKKIDLIIELGLEQYLETDLDLLNIDINLYKRVLLLNRLHIPIENRKQLDNILYNKFSISNDQLDEYIFNKTEFIDKKLIEGEDSQISKQEVVKKLALVQNTKRSYSLDGVILSSNKVIRNLEQIEKEQLSFQELFYIITSNTIIDQDEYNKIVNWINNTKKYQKKKK